MTVSLDVMNPVRVAVRGLSDADRRRLRSALTYRNEKVVYDIKRLRNGAKWFIAEQGAEAYARRLDELRAQQTSCLLDDEDVTYTGFLPRLREMFPDATESSRVVRPPARPQAWLNSPRNPLRPYQREAVEALLANPHSAIEHATGLGKATIILNAVREVGLPSVIQAPSKSTASQLYQDFLYAFGSRYVGFYGDGKKQPEKRYVIAIGQSLVRVEPGSRDWRLLSEKPVYAVDESHLTPAATLQGVCWGLMADACYRWYLSATQSRHDGLERVLEAITGPIVSRMSTREGVDQGYLARPLFRMIRSQSDDDYDVADTIKMHRRHVVHNAYLARQVASYANRLASRGIQVLVLIDELPQFINLLPHLRHPTYLAHGGVRGKESPFDDLPRELRNSAFLAPDNEKLVARFNDREFPILVGTSAVSTGTDFRTVGAILYAMGGSAENQVRQSVGRGTRKPPGKQHCLFLDFDIANIPVLHRQADQRRAIYEDIYGPVEEVL